MAENVMDYQTMLADMEAKKAVLEQAIASLRAALAAGALGTTGSDISGGSILVSPGPGRTDADIPKGAFFQKGVTESINLYLEIVRKKCTTSEIIEGLKKGGLESTSKHFHIVVRNTLYRLKAERKLLLFDDGWGLAEWYPQSLRIRVDQNNKVKGKKPGPKKTTKSKTAKEQETPQPKTLVQNYFSNNLGAEVTAKELASDLGINARGAVLILSQLKNKGWLEKTTTGKFRRPSKVTPISKTA